MLINFVDATNDANHYTKPSPEVPLLACTVGRVNRRIAETCKLALRCLAVDLLNGL